MGRYITVNSTQLNQIIIIFIEMKNVMREMLFDH